MKQIGIGAQELSIFKEHNYIYIDKTKEIHDLIASGRYYFLSRPRRFGKSLLVNTIKELFLGNRELFTNCWIHDHWNWEEQYPVIKVSFTEIDYRTLGLAKALDVFLDQTALSFGITFQSESFSGKFLELIQKLGQEKKVVILIDEYDKPIIDYLEHAGMDQAHENREILKTFYAGIKDQDKYIRFLFMTGISKFSRISIFSVLNHLKDITINEQFSTIVGYTAEEIQENYPDHLKELAKKLKISETETMNLIAQWYNGYSWDGESFLFNPFSVINVLFDKKFDNYWFQSLSRPPETPSFLVKQLKEGGQPINEPLNQWEEGSTFDCYEIDDLNLTAIMFQTGYLTIKEINSAENKYLLDFPNKEVREAFLTFFVKNYAKSSRKEMETVVESLEEALEGRDLDSFLQIFQSLFSSIRQRQLQYVKDYEGYYHSIIYIVLKILGYKIDCEVQSNHGATDAVLKTKETIYVFEFKREKPKKPGAQEALKQIKSKKYHAPYLADKRELYIVGVSFDPKERNLLEILYEVIEK